MDSGAFWSAGFYSKGRGASIGGNRGEARCLVNVRALLSRPMKRLVTFAALAALAFAAVPVGAALGRPDRPLPVEPRPAEPRPDVDGGGTEDAGSVEDAGVIDVDAGSPEEDAGPMESDAGPLLDATIPLVDAGAVDAGMVPVSDAGSTVPDAGTTSDAGVEPDAVSGPDVFNSEPSGGACNCDAAGANSHSPWLLALFGAIVFALRHRRRTR